MDNREEVKVTDKKSSRVKIAIIILSILLALSVLGLAARYIYLNFFAPAQTTATAPDNVITREDNSEGQKDTDEPSDTNADDDTDNGNAGSGTTADKKPVYRPAATLELYKSKPEVNEKFEAVNMFPGDSLTKYFCVKVHHSADVDVFFKTEVTEQTKALGDVLNIKVTHIESGKVLYDAPFAEIDGKEIAEMFKVNSAKESVANYKIDVSLATSVGNEYQAAMLKADFNWYVKDKGALIPPKTGDTSNIILWTVSALTSLALVILLICRKRKEKENGGQSK